MARRESSEWGIEFSISVHPLGYEWRSAAPHEKGQSDTLLLAPAAQIRELESTAKAFAPHAVSKIEKGRGVVRRAYGGFRILARKLTTAEQGEVQHAGPEGGVFIWSRLMPVFTEEERRQAVVEFANKYGSLWGDGDPRSLKDWTQEAAAFLDLDDVAEALRTAQYGAFNERTISREDGFGVEYRSSRYASRGMTIAMPGERIDEQVAANALSRTTDFYERAKRGSSSEKAHMLLARQINKRLTGGLSLRASMTSPGPPTVVPRRLLQALYVRMWLDTLDFERAKRERSCANTACNRTFTAETRRKKFCSDECRWEFNNRRRSMLR